MTAEPAIRIAPCETVAACHACEDLQVAVWGGGEREIIPYDILRAIRHAGGTLLGAWDGSQLIGMALSVVGWGAEGAYHHSHLLGVLPDYQHLGIGWRLKMAQRDAVLAQGLDLITWTFDPLNRRTRTSTSPNSSSFATHICQTSTAHARSTPRCRSAERPPARRWRLRSPPCPRPPRHQRAGMQSLPLVSAMPSMLPSSSTWPPMAT